MLRPTLFITERMLRSSRSPSCVMVVPGWGHHRCGRHGGRATSTAMQPAGPAPDSCLSSIVSYAERATRAALSPGHRYGLILAKGR